MNYELSSRAIAYALRELAIRAGLSVGPGEDPFYSLGVTVRYGDSEWVDPELPSLIILPADKCAVSELLTSPTGSLEWLPIGQALPGSVTWPFGEALPILFRSGRGTPAGAPLATFQGERKVILHVDLVLATLFMLSRWEEYGVKTLDEHGRFTSTQSLAQRQGFLDHPIVDEYGLVLQAWLKALVPNWAPRPNAFRVLLSHGIDTFIRHQSLCKMPRLLAAALIKRHNFQEASQCIHRLAYTIIDGWRARNSLGDLPYFRNVRMLAQLLQKFDLVGHFYFMANELGDPFHNGNGYDVSRLEIQSMIRELQDSGMVVGIHPSYSTHNRIDLLLEEVHHLEEVIGGGAFGGRQHYLRFSVPGTWRDWEAVGLTFDSSLGFADREGFRCGTCHPYRPFDLELDRELRVIEVPLIVMDGTLFNYRRLSDSAARRRIWDLANVCRYAGGVFTLLWHNSSFGGIWEDWITYSDMLADLALLGKESTE